MYEHINTKSEQMEGHKTEDMLVRRMVKEEVNRLNQGSTGGQSTRIHCQTCARKHVSGFDCLGKKCQRCFECGEAGHFKGAPNCKKLKDKDKNKQKNSANIKKEKKG